jgi:hypothetical protein
MTIILRISLLASLYLSIASSAFVRAHDTLWTRTYGGSEKDIGYSVQQTSDGGYIIAGSTESFGEDSSDVYLIKTDMNGDTDWTRTYGGSDSYHGYSVQQTTDGGYIVAGWKKPLSSVNEDIYIVKTNASGTPDWIRSYGEAGRERAYSVKRTTDGGYIITGSMGSFGAWEFDVYPVKVSGDVVGVDDPELENFFPTLKSLSQSYPNPFNASTIIQYSPPEGADVIIDICDLRGRKAETLIREKQPAGSHQVAWDASDYSSGLYSYRIQAGDYPESRKMVLLK